jgi:hypothetical protein
MTDNQTVPAKKGGFILQPDTTIAQAAGGCCGQPVSNVRFVMDSASYPLAVAASGCCGEPVSSDAGSTGCCGEPSEKKGCCG